MRPRRSVQTFRFDQKNHAAGGQAHWTVERNCLRHLPQPRKRGKGDEEAAQVRI